jgi:hypothetical protein
MSRHTATYCEDLLMLLIGAKRMRRISHISPLGKIGVLALAYQLYYLYSGKRRLSS